MSPVIGWIALLVLWCAWLYPFLLRAPHRQNRPSITAAGPSRIGLSLETAAILLAFLLHRPLDAPLGWNRFAPALLLGAVAVFAAWAAVEHLGRQFRVFAGLYDDHELVQTGPYAIVRHPIYSALFAMLLCSLLIVTTWQWAIPCVILYVIGTEIRVHCEDGLLASRFGDAFQAYRRRVRAYVPFIR